MIGNISGSRSSELLAHARHGVFDEDQLIASVIGLASGRFYSEVGRNAADHDCANLLSAEKLIQFGAVEGTPLPLFNDGVSRLYVRFGDQF